MSAEEPNGLVAVMQPTFLPWLGYFDLMDQADHFVYLDSVQFAKQSWQQRNRIRTASGLSWISAPVRIEKRLEQRIDTIALGATPDFPKRCLGLLDQNYRKAPHRAMLDPIFARFEASRDYELLADLLFGLLDDLRTILGITTPTSRSSAMAAQGQRSELVIELVREVGGARYISPPGSLEYLADDVDAYDAADLPVVIHHYEHPTYEQRFSPFEAYASVVDLIANVGPDALTVLRSGRREPDSLAHRLPPLTTGACS